DGIRADLVTGVQTCALPISTEASEIELGIREVNAGLYVFDGPKVLAALEHVEPHNPQGEIYLPDALPVLKHQGAKVTAHLVDHRSEERRVGKERTHRRPPSR